MKPLLFVLLAAWVSATATWTAVPSSALVGQPVTATFTVTSDTDADLALLVLVDGGALEGVTSPAAHDCYGSPIQERCMLHVAPGAPAVVTVTARAAQPGTLTIDAVSQFLFSIETTIPVTNTARVYLPYITE